ncbi:MAG: glycosyltransferase family 2 protein, partial [Candidatus Omnitrophica bacterium]|nr:glycosyltransferase family 2 protein [Candidatus Omnitrophota bacterium]
ALEIILIDNHSADGSIARLRSELSAKELERVRIIENDANHGAAHALNQGAALAQGRYITFLATDTRMDAGCLAELVDCLERDGRIAAVSAKLLMMHEPQRIDSAGEYLNQFGLLMQRHAGREYDAGQFEEQVEIFSVKGTALTVRGDVFESVGGYPDDYFMFLEETDLCWRIWLAGYRIVFVPRAKIYHACGISIAGHERKNFVVKYYGCRNYIMTLFKNLGIWQWVGIVPLHTLMWCALAGYFLVIRRRSEAAYILRAVAWIVLHLPYLIGKRRAVQSRRAVTDRALMPRILRPVPWSYLRDRVNAW